MYFRLTGIGFRLQKVLSMFVKYLTTDFISRKKYLVKETSALVWTVCGWGFWECRDLGHPQLSLSAVDLPRPTVRTSSEKISILFRETAWNGSHFEQKTHINEGFVSSGWFYLGCGWEWRRRWTRVILLCPCALAVSWWDWNLKTCLSWECLRRAFASTDLVLFFRFLAWWPRSGRWIALVFSFLFWANEFELVDL